MEHTIFNPEKMIWKGTVLDGKTRKENNDFIVFECIPNPC